MMHQIYVFSSTGNTLHAAERVGEGLGGAHLINMALAQGKGTEAAGDSVGICYPVHAFGAPAVVHRFIEGLSVDPGSWVYLLITSGGGPLGAAAQGIGLLAQRGVRVRGGFHVKMPGNYPPLYDSPSGGKLRRMVDRADGVLGGIVEDLRNRREKRPWGSSMEWLSRWANGSALASVGAKDRSFYATSSCVRCGRCVALCPVGNVEQGEEGLPRWMGRCTQCMACFHWCPTQAVQFNTTTSLRRHRYHHPAVSPERFLAWSGR